MVCHVDVVPYLVAAKSFYRHIGRGQFIVLNDGTLDSCDLDVIASHLGNPQVLNVRDVDTEICPRGGCWERLLSIVDINHRHYVIQLDADTVTRSDVPEVLRCIESDTSFILGTEGGIRFISADQASANARRNHHPLNRHVQIEAEIALGKLPGAEHRRYVRGSAGFAGFARGAFTRNDVFGFSQEMTAHLGNRWTEWGTEQVTSNYLVANAQNSTVLPLPKYRCFRRGVGTEESAFLHFVGIYRYDEGAYVRESRNAIRDLTIRSHPAA